MIDWSKVEYFRPSEFACKCCQEVIMDSGFIGMLVLARTLADIPFSITSGYRCKEHNRSVGGKLTSSHVLGLAADIKTAGSQQRFRIVTALIDAGFTRIGIGADFIHADNDLDKVQGVLWLY